MILKTTRAFIMSALCSLFFLVVLSFPGESRANQEIAAQNMPSLVGTDWLAEHLNDKDLLVLEVRSNETKIQFKDGHIPNAVFAGSTYFMPNTPDKTNIPYDIPPVKDFENLVRQLGINSSSKVVIVYPGLIPKDVMCATRTYWTFKYYGMTNIAILDGGFGKWQREARPVSTTTKTIAAGNFTVAITQEENLATLESVKSAVLTGNSILLDARMNSDYTGATVQPFIPEKGHISGSISYFAPMYLNSDLTFKTARQIKYEMGVLGITDNKPIISYCNSGQFATTTWFALKEIAGYKEVSSYDGSVSEWVNRGKLPLEKDYVIH